MNTEQPTETKESDSDWVFYFIWLVVFGLGIVIGNKTVPEPKPATIKYISQSGVELTTSTIYPGKSLSVIGLESVTLTTNHDGVVNIGIHFAPYNYE